MNRLVVLFRSWLETSSQKQKLTAALFVFGILSTLGLIVLQGASGTDPTMDATPLYFVSVFAKLIVVLLLIVLTSILFRRWLQPAVVRGRTRQVQLLETIRLSPKQALHLITVGNKQLLVGATDQGISLITQVDLDLQAEEMDTTLHQPVTDFGSLLKTLNLPVRNDRSS